MAIAWTSFSLGSCNSDHISMRAVAEILWSSGNEPRSMKYSLRMVLSAENSRLFWRQSSTSASESKIEWPSDHFVSLLSQTPARCPRSEPPITLRAIGNPPQPLTNCNSSNHIKSVVVYRLKGNNIGHDFSCLNHTLYRNMTFFFLPLSSLKCWVQFFCRKQNKQV